MKTAKFQCESCGYYWEIKNGEHTPKYCPSCKSEKIYKAVRHKRFAKKSRPKVRGLVTNINVRT
jgi:predicted Zn-ribbon and HTH transcriptional regulator